MANIYQRSNLAILELTSYGKVVKFSKWKNTMQKEIHMIEKNQTWLLVDRPNKKNIIGVKWIFKTKLNADGSISKHKAKLVAKGYSK